MVDRLERIVFFGTPEFALPSLEALCGAGRPPLLVVTQPDRPAGRGQQLQSPPVARWARAQGLEVWQPATVREPVAQERLAAARPDLAIVAAFGQIFPPALLTLPRSGCINVHASLLPRHRGAAPVQASLLAGDDTTGVSIMRMEAGLDTGPVLLRLVTRLSGHETAGELLPRLAHLGAGALLEALAGVEAGTLSAVAQEEAGATSAPRLRKDQGRVDWKCDAQALYRQLRAFTPWPGLTADVSGDTVKVLQGEPLRGDSSAPPGSVLGLREGALAVVCGSGTLFGIRRLQRPGKRPVEAADYARAERPAGSRRSA